MMYLDSKHYGLLAALSVALIVIWGRNAPPQTDIHLRGNVIDLGGRKTHTFVKNNIKDFMIYKHPQKESYPKPVDLIYYQIAACMHTPNMLFLDIGANVGQFVESVFDIWGRQRYRTQLQEWKTRGVRINPARFQGDTTAIGDPTVHVFEPMPGNFKALQQMKDRYPDGHVFLNQNAVSNKPGTMPVYDGGNTQGENGGNTQGGLLKQGNVVTNVTVTTIDEYVAKNKLSTLHVVKIDVEGFELEVFEGMKATVMAGKLKLFTFEYGEKWSAPRPNYPEGVQFKTALDMLDAWGFDSYLVGFHCWVQISGSHYHPYYEDRSWDTGLVSVEVVSIHRDHPKYNWLTAPVDWCASTPGI